MFLTRFGQRTTRHNITTSVIVNIEREPERMGKNTRVGMGEFKFPGTRRPSCVRDRLGRYQLSRLGPLASEWDVGVVD